jgi:tetratricopeptide (TPR) repeat protein
MNNKIVQILVILLISLNTNIAMGDEMKNSFFTWDDFVKNFAGQLVSAQDVFTNMTKSGLTENAILKFDFHFISNNSTKIKALHTFLKDHYLYTFEPIFEREDKLWELTGLSNGFPVTSDNLMYWVLDMYKRGYEFDSQLDGYGAPYDPAKQILPDFSAEKEDYYFDLALDRYDAGDLSGAIINWSQVLKINPKEVNSYYSRAIVKAQLYTWKSALKDYDLAIEIAPDFTSALLNRGSLRDENEDYNGAIQDYDRVINNSNSDAEDRKKAYFNKGNTHYNLSNSSEACKHWKKASELGADYAREQMQKFCEKF